MKFLIAFAAIAAVAVAVPVQRALVTPGLIGPTPVVDENGAPIAIGPAILDTSPISVGPAIIETSPIAVGPAIVDFPLPDGGVVTAEEPTPVQPSPVITPSPVVIGEIPSGQSPLVQIIVNVNQQESVVVPAPVDTPVIDEIIVPGPVNVVDNVVIPEPVQVVEPVIVEPVQVAEPVIVEPVQVAEPVIVEPVQVAQPVVVEPVVVGTPIIPAPVVVLPEILN